MRLIKLTNDCHVLKTDNAMYMFSYDTCMAKYDTQNRNFFLIKYYDSYSLTTMKHIYAFSKHIGMNIDTREALGRRIKNGWILLTDEIRLTEENS